MNINTSTLKNWTHYITSYILCVSDSQQWRTNSHPTGKVCFIVFLFVGPLLVYSLIFCKQNKQEINFVCDKTNEISSSIVNLLVSLVSSKSLKYRQHYVHKFLFLIRNIELN